MISSRMRENNEDDSSGDSYNCQLLSDIKGISVALYEHKAPWQASISPSQIRSKSVGKTCVPDSKRKPNRASQEDKKSSMAWNWKKPLQALAHVGQHRFEVCFVLHVHSIEGLPLDFNGSCLAVQWRRKDEVLSTQPSRVSDGTAKFDETLVHRCSVFCNKPRPQKPAQYDMKHFLIYASAVGAPWLDLGHHWIDLTRLLPLSLDELESEKSMGKWTTSFKLLGVANGAALNVSFGCLIIKDNFVNSHQRAHAASNSSKSSETLRWVGSVPSNLGRWSSKTDTVRSFRQSSSNLNLDLSRSIDILYRKLKEGNLEISEPTNMSSEHIKKPKHDQSFEIAMQSSKCDDIENKEETKLSDCAVQNIDSSAIEVIDVSEILKDEDSIFEKEIKSIDWFLMDESRNEEITVSTGQSMLGESFNSESSSLMNGFLEQQKFLEVKSGRKAKKTSMKSSTLDDITESVANDFLNLLELEDCLYDFASDTEPESPRERLLREFEKEALASGNLFLDCNGKMEYGSEPSDHEDHHSEDFSFSSTLRSIEDNNNKNLGKYQITMNRIKAKVVEDLDTEALARELGLKEIKNSQRVQSHGFGSPIELEEAV